MFRSIVEYNMHYFVHIVFSIMLKNDIRILISIMFFSTCVEEEKTRILIFCKIPLNPINQDMLAPWNHLAKMKIYIFTF